MCPTVPPGKFYESTAFDLAKFNQMTDLEPPFVVMRSPKGTPLTIAPELHWFLLFSLTLSQENIPMSKFKVTHLNHKRTMVVQLAKDGSLSLRREDQTNFYNIEWVPGVESRCCALRAHLLNDLSSQPTKAKSIQFSMLQMVLSVPQLLAQQGHLKDQIQEKCYGNNAWMVMTDGKLCWRVADSIASDVASQQVFALESSTQEPSLFEALATKRGKWTDDLTSADLVSVHHDEGQDEPEHAPEDEPEDVETHPEAIANDLELFQSKPLVAVLRPSSRRRWAEEAEDDTNDSELTFDLAAFWGRVR